MKQPNIILLMTDQLRADALGYAGHPDVKTPYLDTLASRGVNFDRAYSACPSCIAARAALHTGMEQSHHGRVGYEDNVPWRYPHTMAGELSKAGYYTQCVGNTSIPCGITWASTMWTFTTGISTLPVTATFPTGSPSLWRTTTSTGSGRNWAPTPM